MASVRSVVRLVWAEADRIVLLWLASAAVGAVLAIERGGNVAFAFGLGLVAGGTAYVVVSVGTRHKALFLAGAPLVAVGLLLQLV